MEKGSGEPAEEDENEADDEEGDDDSQTTELLPQENEQESSEEEDDEEVEWKRLQGKGLMPFFFRLYEMRYTIVARG